MKKIFIIFLSMIVLSLSLVLPSFAVMTDSFGSYSNLFDPSDVVQARFYTSPSSYQDNNFYTVNLQANQTYTFISTSGSKSFYVGEQVLYNNYNSVFSFDSWNLAEFNTYSFQGVASGYNNLILCTITEPGTYYLSYDATSNIDTYNLVFLSNNIRVVATELITSGNNHVSVSFEVYESDLVNGSCQVFFRPYDVGGSIINLDITDLNLFISSSDTYLPSYIEPVYNNGLTYLYIFNCQKSGTYLIGINDVLAGSVTNQFSYNQSSENEFYLVAGSLTPDQIADALQQDRYNQGYNQGYTQGYKDGEYDGMNSTSIFKSVILTIFSGPFVVVSNALNFEIFGINLYTLIQILLTILVVAFLITRLKGRE